MYYSCSLTRFPTSIIMACPTLVALLHIVMVVQAEWGIRAPVGLSHRNRVRHQCDRLRTLLQLSSLTSAEP